MLIPAYIGKVLILVLKRVQAFKACALVHVTVKYLSGYTICMCQSLSGN